MYIVSHCIYNQSTCTRQGNGNVSNNDWSNAFRLGPRCALMYGTLIKILNINYKSQRCNNLVPYYLINYLSFCKIKKMIANSMSKYKNDINENNKYIDMWNSVPSLKR